MERIINSVDFDGNEVSVKVVSPDAAAVREGQAAYNKSFRTALENGNLLRQKLSEYMEEQGLWDNEKEEEYTAIIQKISDNEEALSRGGIPLKEARDLALELKSLRAQFTALLAERNQLDQMTAEGTADNARFNSLICSCVRNMSGQKIWNSIEDYDLEANQPWATEGATALANMIYGLEEDYEKSRPEHKFLVEYKFTNEDGKLINEDGHLCDNEGRLVDEDGHYIKYDKDGNITYVTRDGEELEEKDGPIARDFSPFLDDKGKPVSPPSEENDEEKEEPKKPARRSRKTTPKS